MRGAFVCFLLGMMVASPAMATPKFLHCVPFAREASGIELHGDAWTWWSSAKGRYDRGASPKPGSVLVFKKGGSMVHGHVAVVSSVVDTRRIRVDHANWAPRGAAGRGKVTEDVQVLDVSPKNDWSQVRVWHAPSGDFGVRVYAAYGFIYAPAKGLAAESAPAGEVPDGCGEAQCPQLGAAE
ncbi:CHAP domain-containing protein [Telmatospirillum sp. J64-1]|uniref:CHAP domain-containing protein n=1 Tax=Telmatospirillum sp. J64-1 TaxID=2502183 RepID=UPI002105E319|nr:CHAP domain-containing protein [Telmatospirillum sp. J64-1]